MKLALVVGCADCVWDEVEAAQKLATFDEIYCVKMSGIYWEEGPFHWITLHPEYMAAYKEKRAALNLPSNFDIIAPLINEVGNHWQHAADRRVSFRWNVDPITGPELSSSGSSGLFAVRIAMIDGCDRIVLAGVPMTKEGRHFARGHEWQHTSVFTGAWEQAASRLRGRVKSFSGWTMNLLGAPDVEWLARARDAQAQAGVTPGSGNMETANAAQADCR